MDKGICVVIKPGDLALGLGVSFLSKEDDTITKVRMLPYHVSRYSEEPVMHAWHYWLEDHAVSTDIKNLATYRINTSDLPELLTRFTAESTMNPCLTAEHEITGRTKAYNSPIEFRMVQSFVYGDGPDAKNSTGAVKVAGNDIIATQMGQPRAYYYLNPAEISQFLRRNVPQFDQSQLMQYNEAIAAKYQAFLGQTGFMRDDDLMVVSGDYCFTEDGPVLVENHLVLRAYSDSDAKTFGISPLN